MNGRSEQRRERRETGRGECVRQAIQGPKVQGMGVSGIPRGGGRGRCWGGSQASSAPQEGPQVSTLGSRVEELIRKVEALEHRLAGTAQTHEATCEPKAP